MKMRTIRITDLIMEDLLKGTFPNGKVLSNVPKDLKVLHADHDPYKSVTIFVVSSEEFEDIPDMYPIPEFSVVFKGDWVR